jgi:hypothetical protein
LQSFEAVIGALNRSNIAHYAGIHCFRDYPEAVSLLLDSGLRLNEQALAFALDHGLDEIAEVLIAYGGELPEESN